MEVQFLRSFYKENVIECGCDEAGRGCLAGPVVAAAVILPSNYQNKDINDSKTISGPKRIELRKIIENDALAWAVGVVDNTEIDQINILNASILAMHMAIGQLGLIPGHIIVDGNRFKKYASISHTCIVKGDSKFLSIAAASILAKTYRDDLMHKLHQHFPVYGWDKNKAYPTKEHRAAIKKHGITPFHRMSYKLTNDQLSFDFPA
jgi:ribonuclease HII